ncbi:Histone domain-containing protein [Aphelenchoides besseyi]|nr:Histone domain-containing protein [Aphelenchoides besseyi]
MNNRYFKCSHRMSTRDLKKSDVHSELHLSRTMKVAKKQTETKTLQDDYQKVKHAVIQDQSYRQQIVAKKRRFKAGTKALMEIRKYQKSTALLIQKAPFCRVVKDTIYEMSGRQDMRVQSEAVSALQEAAEAFIIQLFEAASLCARHGRRVTVMPADFQLVRNVLNIFTSGGLIT